MTRPINVAAGVNPAPSLDPTNRADVEVVDAVPAGAQAVGVLVAPDGGVPAELALSRDELLAAGFKGEVGQALLVPGTPVRIAVGMGVAAELTRAKLRDAAAAFALAAARHGDLALGLAGLPTLAPGEAAQAVVEGAELARYRYEPLKTKDTLTPLQSLTLVVGAGDIDVAQAGAQRGLVMSAATELARDLADAPPAHLTATRMAEIATGLGRERASTSRCSTAKRSSTWAAASSG